MSESATVFTAQTAGSTAPSGPGHVMAGRRFFFRHWVFTVAILGGAALRWVTQFAYTPALLFSDSARYIEGAQQLRPPDTAPFGYALILRPLLALGDLGWIPAFQHLVALAIATAFYLVLLRLSLPGWLAALAVVPYLYDGWQLNIEQYVLADTWFQAMIAATVCLLLWQKGRVAPLVAGAAGFLAAAAALTRFAGLPLILVVIGYLLLSRSGWRSVAVSIVAFVLPLLGYAGWNYTWTNQFTLSVQIGHFAYARVAGISDCAGRSLPPAEAQLCPTQPLGDRLIVNDYMWAGGSPINNPRFGGPTERYRAGENFAWGTVKRQPYAYVKEVSRDVWHGFAPTHAPRKGVDIGIRQWQFANSYPYASSGHSLKFVRQYGDDRITVDTSYASFLRSYQSHGYLPGTANGIFMLTGFVGAAGAWRARRSGLRSACFLLAGSGLVVLYFSAAFAGFSWRYQLPATMLFPPAAAVAVYAIVGGRRNDVTTPETTADDPVVPA